MVPGEPELESLLNNLTSPFLVVALDGVVSAENVGVIVRNCAAFGVDAIFAGTNSSSPYLRRAVRNSMGTVFKLPVIHGELTGLLSILKKRCRILCADAEATRSVYEADITGNLCIVFGNEGTGISGEILSQCSERISVPMMNETDSLNVACASAVILYEIRKRRDQKR
jgi:tRNA G18 (ribose-2'-O)-methylase SpoU